MATVCNTCYLEPVVDSVKKRSYVFIFCGNTGCGKTDLDWTECSISKSSVWCRYWCRGTMMNDEICTNYVQEVGSALPMLSEWTPFFWRNIWKNEPAVAFLQNNFVYPQVSTVLGRSDIVWKNVMQCSKKSLSSWKSDPIDSVLPQIVSVMCTCPCGYLFSTDHFDIQHILADWAFFSGVQGN